MAAFLRHKSDSKYVFSFIPFIILLIILNHYFIRRHKSDLWDDLLASVKEPQRIEYTAQMNEVKQLIMIVFYF